jgi:hypothetical protein
MVNSTNFTKISQNSTNFAVTSYNSENYSKSKASKYSLLLEGGDYLLLENSDYIQLEIVENYSTNYTK